MRHSGSGILTVAKVHQMPPVQRVEVWSPLSRCVAVGSFCRVLRVGGAPLGTLHVTLFLEFVGAFGLSLFLQKFDGRILAGGPDALFCRAATVTLIERLGLHL